MSQASTAYQASVKYPTGPFSAGLQVLAEAIVQNLGLRVGYVTLGGFDTHANQQTTHDLLMKTLADGLAAFYQDLTQHGKADNVVVMTWSRVWASCIREWEPGDRPWYGCSTVCAGQSREQRYLWRAARSHQPGSERESEVQC